MLEKRGLNWCAVNLWENWKNLEKRKQPEKNARMGVYAVNGTRRPLANRSIEWSLRDNRESFNQREIKSHILQVELDAGIGGRRPPTLRQK